MNFTEMPINEIVVSISFDNLCNLKCITCTPINSSQLAIEVKNPVLKKKYTSIHKKEPIKTEFLKKMLTDANISSLRIEILGGEPLINPAVYNFLDWLIEQPYASSTWVNLTSNGTTFDDRFVKYIKHFRLFSLQLSVDGIENTFEYIRFGAKFSTLKEVTDKFYQLRIPYSEKFGLSFNYTLSWMNALHIEDFFNWVNTNYPDVQHTLVTKLEWPHEYDISILPIEIRTQIVERVSKTIIGASKGVQSGFDYYKQHMLNTPDNTALFCNIKLGMNTLARNDKLINRNSDFKITFNPILDILTKNNII
jgi:sulfatase maturation enzyme AslB (radical SAM superfamily)